MLLCEWAQEKPSTDTLSSPSATEWYFYTRSTASQNHLNRSLCVLSTSGTLGWHQVVIPHPRVLGQLGGRVQLLHLSLPFLQIREWRKINFGSNGFIHFPWPLILPALINYVNTTKGGEADTGGGGRREAGERGEGGERGGGGAEEEEQEEREGGEEGIILPQMSGK